ncbi:protein of unknown function [Paraburkholderia dioscoreae]|uniref:Uncharacterized protein n=1 Tax=Paraburkholderia dioscoreae TaxID=2604047 RepID=A0A5Q4ZQ86_9BURK|nr:protein of unknown function [Paraburkholderia dioscoreae]
MRTIRQCCALNGVLARQGCVKITGKSFTTLVVTRRAGKHREARVQAVQAARNGALSTRLGVMRQPRSSAVACPCFTTRA